MKKLRRIRSRRREAADPPTDKERIHTNNRRSKIAKLPKPIRHELNLMIESHASARNIIAFLTERGHPDINEVNITDWIHGDHNGSSGYLDWLREQHQAFSLQARREFASDLIAQADGPQIHEATRLTAASKLSEVIIGFNIQRLKEALTAKPVAFATLVTALRRLSRDNLAYQKYLA